VQRRASKVPILGDIPVLGRLFRTDAAGDEKVNLIVILTPHIIRNASDLERVSEDRKQGFHEGEPEAEVPFPPTGEPFVIPAEPQPSGPAYSPDEGRDTDRVPSTSRRPFAARPSRS
jgi:Flp pilus assembly secretin CpaC